MVKLFGKRFGRDELLRRVGSIDQVGGVTLLEQVEGAGRGVRVAHIRTGKLSFKVVIDRAMDIAEAEYMGIPIGWMSPTGIVSPYFYEPEKFGWLRGFFGGLLTTCGLTYMGAPTIDQGEELGLHGRISYSPASLLSAGGEWRGDDYVIHIEGESREARVFEPALSIRRRIETRLGESVIEITDRVKNYGWLPQPLMIIYHINIGFPLLDSNARLYTTSKLIVPRDPDAAEGVENFDSFSPPTKGFREKVYFHDMMGDEEGYAYAAIVNRELLDGLAVCVRFKTSQLGRFYEWKMLGEGTYVVGIEPANALPMGRDKEREWNTLPMIAPQEQKIFQLSVEIIEGKLKIDQLLERINNVTHGRRPSIVTTIDEFLKITRELPSR